MLNRDRIRKLFEMPALNNKNQSLGTPNDDKKDQDTSKYEECQSEWNQLKVIDLPSNGTDAETVEFFRQGNKIRAFILTSNYTVVGFFAGETNTTKALPPSFIKVIVTYVYKDYQGNGFGYKFYEDAMSLFGGIISDSEITSGTMAIWKKLATKYPFYVLSGSTVTPSKFSKVLVKNISDNFVSSKAPLKV